MTAPRQSPSTNSPAKEAARLLEAGRTLEAEELVLHAAERARTQFGAGSTQDASAQSDLGTVLVAMGRLDRAIEAFRESVSGPTPADEQGTRDRLTFLLNYGQTLVLARKLDEAAEALHKGLEGREKFYGREHAGYAFGLEPLAEVMYRQGKLDMAYDMIDETVHNFWKNGHKRVAGAIAIRAEIAKAMHRPEPALAGLEKLPADYIEELARKAIARSGRADDLKISRAVLAELIPLLEARLGDAHAQTSAAIIAASNIERKLGKDADPVIRQSAIRKLIAIFDSQGQHSRALQAEMSLALAQSEAGDNAAAVETYRQALHRADAINDPHDKASLLRNYGLLLADLNHHADAEKMLKQALAEGELSQDSELLARTLVALGIFVQHHGRLSEARPILARALPMLDPAHPDAIACRSHLQAIDKNQNCGCNDTSAALVEAFKEFVTARAPKDLLERLDVSLQDGSFSVNVQVKRQPNQQELEKLHRAMEHASQEFEKRLTQGS